MTEMLPAADLPHAITTGERPGFNTRAHLRNAELQARERGYDEILIVDVDAHHYENEWIFENMNRFLSVHALGFVLNNLVHTTNLVVNGIPERFPDLKFIMIESGLAWIPFLTQRLDNEWEMRTNEAPLLTKRPSEYLRESFYYTTQPIELTDMGALETTLRMIHADTQLMFSSDYPHWDVNLPSTIYDLPFLDREAKLNILGRNALEVFPRLKEDVKRDGLAGAVPSERRAADGHPG